MESQGTAYGQGTAQQQAGGTASPHGPRREEGDVVEGEFREA
jgi:hypothetical protein